MTKGEIRLTKNKPESRQINVKRNKETSDRGTSRNKCVKNENLSKNLTILCLNARSLKSKFDNIVAHVITNEFDIVCITETWLNFENSEFIAEFSIRGYKLFHSDRLTRRGGGVIIYVKETVNPTQIKIDNINNIEICGFKFTDGLSRMIHLVTIYRAPNTDQNADNILWETLLNIFQGKETIIVGDLNLPVKTWGENYTHSYGKRLYENILLSELIQGVRFTTRLNHILDPVLYTNHDIISNISEGEPFSDHKSIIIETNIQTAKKTPTRIKFLNYGRANFTAIENEIKSIQIDTISPLSVDESWNFIKNKVVDAQSRHIPCAVVKSNKIIPWFSHKIKKKVSLKNNLYKLMIKHGGRRFTYRYNKLNKNVKKQIHRERVKYEQKVALLSKTDSKKFFSYIKNRKVLHEKIETLNGNNNEKISGSKEKAEILNNYFASVFTIENTTEEGTVEPNINENIVPFTDIQVTTDDVIAIIKKLKYRKSPGPDGILACTLKRCSKALAPLLKLVFEKSVNSGTIPPEWKTANVTPIYKKGDKCSPSNYRPISLTSLVVKILETVIKRQLVGHLETNGLLLNSQYGFREKRSCLTNLIQFYDEIMQNFNNHDCMDVVFLDFQKAFDKVSHSKLIEKLANLHIGGNALHWIKNWLNDRQQRVIINEESSSPLPVSSGVPQGSVLGPTLFVCYINDLEDKIKCPLVKFADDTKLWAHSVNAESAHGLQANINEAYSWSKKWKMSFNADKCKIMHIGRNNPKNEYYMNGTLLPKTCSERDLGIKITPELNFSSHIDLCVKKANRMLGLIGRSFTKKTVPVIINLYKSMVRPHLDYCSPFWNPYLKKDIDKIECVQRRATKMIPDLRGKTYEDRIAVLGLTTLETRRIKQDLIQLFKILRGIDYFPIENHFKFCENRNRGHSMKLVKASNTNNISKYRFCSRIVGAWNSLPTDIIESETLREFKIKLKNYMVTKEIKYFIA